MKKKVRLIVTILAIVLLLGIIGIGIYVNIPVKISEYGITMSISNVSSTGLDFHVERDDEDEQAASLRTWPDYKLYEYRSFRWLPISLEREYVYELETQDAKLITNQFEHTWEVDWKEGCGSLPTGLYRMEKEIGRPNRATVYSVPFFVINWIQLLVEILAIVGICAGVWALWKLGLWKKAVVLVEHKKKMFIIMGAIVVALAMGLILYLKIPAKDSEWGISLRVTESSPTGVTYELKRNDTEKPWDLFTENTYALEKWTLLGWEELDGTLASATEVYDIAVEYSETCEADWEYEYGNLPGGLYRLSKDVTVEGYYKYDATGIESLELTYYAPFVIVVWWEILLITIGIVLLTLLIWLEVRYKVIRRVWKKVMQNRKRNLLIGLAIILVILTGCAIVGHVKGKVSAAYWKYEVAVDEVTTDSIHGTITYHGNEKDNVRRFLRLETNFKLQAKTWYGWKTVKTISESGIYGGMVREGNSSEIGFEWSEKLTKGTYRIVQPFNLYRKSEGVKPGGNIYIVFEVE